jgi:16S rRNA (uracil1498-N3)-methyltransferase
VVVDNVSSPTLSIPDAHHVGAVLRIRPGELMTATDGRGGLVSCRYVGGASLEAIDSPTFSAPPSPLLTVGFAPVKGDRPEWAVQKLTEIGVDRIVLLCTERAVVRWDGERASSHLERLRRVAREAVMQSRGRWLPSVSGLTRLSSLLGEGVGMAGVALADPGGPPPTLDCPTLLIGPEGGWSPGELEMCPARVGLGQTVLRTETAAVAAGILLVALRSHVVRQI